MGWSELESSRMFAKRRTRREGEEKVVNLESRASAFSLNFCLPSSLRSSLLQLEDAERRCYLVCHKPAILLIQSQVSKFLASKFRALIAFLLEPSPKTFAGTNITSRACAIVSHVHWRIPDMPLSVNMKVFFARFRLAVLPLLTAPQASCTCTSKPLNERTHLLECGRKSSCRITTRKRLNRCVTGRGWRNVFINPSD